MHKEHQSIIQEINNCAAECNHCFSECLNEKDVAMMARCIELDRDCADICQLTSALLARDSEYAHKVMQLCAQLCEECAEECAKHDADHCRKCADTCRRCAEVCHSHA